MANVYKMIIEEFNRRNAADYSKFPPFFVCSIGCHFFNMINEQKNMWTEAGITVNTRLHILFVAPQGQQKSFWLKQFLEKETSILKGTTIKTAFEMRMTESGYIGTVHFDKNQQSVKREGLCEEEDKSIVGIEEFSDLITSASVQDFNIGLDNELLTTLDSGMANKRLAAGKLSYQTRLTLWTATQPARYNLEGGLGRRFLFIFNVPTEQSMRDLKLRRRGSINIDFDEGNLFEIKKELNLKFDQITMNLNKISFDPAIHRYLDTLNIANFEETLYERLALGYNIMTADHIGNEIVVRLDPELRKLINMQWAWRKAVKEGPEDSMVWTFVKSTGGINRERCHEVLLDFGMKPNAARQALKNLVKRGLITLTDDRVELKEKKKVDIDLKELEQEIIE